MLLLPHNRQRQHEGHQILQLLLRQVRGDACCPLSFSLVAVQTISPHQPSIP
jgi:hypothetical protein